MRSSVFAGTERFPGHAGPVGGVVAWGRTSAGLNHLVRCTNPSLIFARVPGALMMSDPKPMRSNPVFFASVNSVSSPFRAWVNFFFVVGAGPGGSWT